MIENILLVAYIILLIITSLIVFILYRKEIKMEEGAILINFDPSRTNGRVLGTIVNEEIGKDERRIIYFVPKDIELTNFNKNEIQKIITPASNMLPLPKGSFSNDRSIIMIFPYNIDRLKREFDTNNLFHKFISNASEMSAESVRIQSLKVKIERMIAQINEYGEGEMSEITINQFKDLLENLLQTASETKQKSIYPSLPKY